MVVEGKKTVKPTPSVGNMFTVLSIDGGGLRGIIPGAILAFLESQLQVTESSSDLLHLAFLKD